MLLSLGLQGLDYISLLEDFTKKVACFLPQTVYFCICFVLTRILTMRLELFANKQQKLINTVRTLMIFTCQAVTIVSLYTLQNNFFRSCSSSIICFPHYFFSTQIQSYNRSEILLNIYILIPKLPTIKKKKIQYSMAYTQMDDLIK